MIRRLMMMGLRIWVVVVAFGFMAGNAVSDSRAQSHARVSPKQASICGNPMIACRTTATFQSNDLPFRVPKDAVIIDTVPFYAIILQSAAAKSDRCDDFIPESDRLAAQALFPDHKVFSSRCTDPENSRYEDVTTRKITNLSDTNRIMAVYAGLSSAESKQFLEKVRATGKFPGANLRRLRTGFNGT
jgi:hypothetical protein